MCFLLLFELAGALGASRALCSTFNDLRLCSEVRNTYSLYGGCFGRMADQYVNL
jgi:hypothetical protein